MSVELVHLTDNENDPARGANLDTGSDGSPSISRSTALSHSTTSSSPASKRTRRKSTGKKLRFEVFKRDFFTCQYCGAQPPDVVLVADHIDPVARGGETSIDNLITACEACNQGKSDRPLTDRVIRPDADLLYLETKQEIAEHSRYLMAARERESLIEEIVQDLQQLWADTTGFDWMPSESVIRRLLIAGEPWQVQFAIEDVAVKVVGGYLSTDSTAWVPYLFGCVRNLAKESEIA